jgi:hypothetical protein
MITIFLGPSLPRQRAEAALESSNATILPPAAQGDIYRCWRTRPSAIVLIDGYFNEVPAPWHKEILWVLSKGTPVIGASSMGALRAAELAAFGMVGVGKVFSDYMDGRLVADDEVALLHGDEDSGYVHFSVPLVDIRATLQRAKEQAILTSQQHDSLVEAARAMPYPLRQYSSIIDACGGRQQFADFVDWVDRNSFSQKACDAEAALGLAISGDCPVASDSDWSFERTAMWEDLIRKNSNSVQTIHDFQDDERIDGLERDNSRRERLMMMGLARLLAVDYAHRSGHVIDEEDLLRHLTRLRFEKGLETPDQLSNWMVENGLSNEGITYLLEAEVHLAETISAFSSDIRPHVLDQMRIEGLYTEHNQTKSQRTETFSREGRGQ